MDVTVGWARRIADDVLGQATTKVGNPVAYVLAVVRKDPRRYHPSDGPPPVRQVLDQMRGDVA
jgi:hypothetical protein